MQLADPYFGYPGRIGVLLGVDVFIEVLLHSWQIRPPGTPVTLETKCGWDLAGRGNICFSISCIISHHTLLLSENDLLHKFREIEEH